MNRSERPELSAGTGPGVRRGAETAVTDPGVRRGAETAGTDLVFLRATETWQRAGAYYVRIQAMAKKHHITLPQEFDGHDGPETKYILVTDADFPVATARMYPLEEPCPEGEKTAPHTNACPAGSAEDQTAPGMMIGRVVVLPEYRHRGIGTEVVRACEEWARELGCARTVLESRDNKVPFYEQMGYAVCGEPVEGDTFRTVRMQKEL